MSVSGSARRTSLSIGARRVAHRHGDIEHVDVERGAVAARDAEALAARLLNLGRSPWFSTVRSASASSSRVADDGAVGRDEGDARRHEPAERVGLGVELRRRGGLAVRQRFGGEPRLVDERALDALADAAPHAPRHQRHGDDQRHRGGGEGA